MLFLSLKQTGIGKACTRIIRHILIGFRFADIGIHLLRLPKTDSGNSCQHSTANYQQNQEPAGKNKCLIHELFSLPRRYKHEMPPARKRRIAPTTERHPLWARVARFLQQAMSDSAVCRFLPVLRQKTRESQLQTHDKARQWI